MVAENDDGTAKSTTRETVREILKRGRRRRWKRIGKRSCHLDSRRNRNDKLSATEIIYYCTINMIKRATSFFFSPLLYTSIPFQNKSWTTTAVEMIDGRDNKRTDTTRGPGRPTTGRVVIISDDNLGMARAFDHSRSVL